MVPVKRDGIIIFRIHDHGKHSDVIPGGPYRSIGKHCGCQPLPMKSFIDSETAKSSGGEGWVSRKTFRHLLRRIIDRDVSSRERVEPGYFAGRDFFEHITRSYAAAHVLAGLFLEISIKRIDTTTKGRSVLFPENCNAKGRLVHESAINRL